MNRTQKVAVVNLVGMVLGLLVIAYLFIEIFALKRVPQGFFGRFWPIAAFGLLVAASVVLQRRKQSDTEVQEDERDNLIKVRATVSAFVSLAILLGLWSIVPGFIVGQAGCVPVWLLALVNVGIFIAALGVHSAAILIQYGWGGKRGKQ